MTQSTIKATNQVVARVLLSAIFITSGLSKISAYEGTQGYMEAMGVPGALLPLVIMTEVIGGLFVLLGFKTRYAAFLLAGFSILSGILFHFNLSDQIQTIMLMKNFTIAGGLLLLVSGETHTWSVDQKLTGNKATSASANALA